MKKGFLAIAFVVMLTFCTGTTLQAQYFQFDNSELYQTPKSIEDAVGASLKMFGAIVGGGLFHTADLHSVGGLDVGLRGAIASVPDEFDDVPVFIDADNVGLAFLHGSLGLPGNLELIGRFFYFPMGTDGSLPLSPPEAVDSRGGVTLIGGGLKYGILQAPLLPKVMIMGTYHVLMVPKEFDFGTVGTLSFKAVASYSIPLFTAFIGGGIDISRLTLDDDLPLFPDLGGESFNENSTSATFGLTVSPLPLVNVNASYTIGEFNTLAVGVGIGLR